MFLDASNLRSLQAACLKFYEHVDILVQIIYAKFKNDRAKNNRYIGCPEMERNNSEDFSSLYFTVVLQYNVQIATI